MLIHSVATVERMKKLAALVGVFVLAGCGSDAGSGSEATGESAQGAASASSSASGSTANAEYPDVLAAELSGDGDSYSLSVTMSSEYDTPERYADGWRVLDPDGNELGTWELGHDHAGEQPFTRTQTGLEIPDDVTEVTVEGRDQANGYGGATVTVEVP